jgi:hypothetical protein
MSGSGFPALNGRYQPESKACISQYNVKRAYSSKMRPFFQEGTAEKLAKLVDRLQSSEREAAQAEAAAPEEGDGGSAEGGASRGKLATPPGAAVLSDKDATIT